MTANTPTTKDLLDAVPGLRLADRDWRNIVGLRHPMKVAIWLALMRPVEELDSRADGTQQVGGDNTEPSERSSIPAILALGEALVRKAVRGDTAAINTIADRIEGRVGMRKGEVDDNDSTRRADMGAAIEAVVRALTDAKAADVIESESLDITPMDGPPNDRIHSRSNGHANGANGHDEDDRSIEIGEEPTSPH